MHNFQFGTVLAVALAAVVTCAAGLSHAQEVDERQVFLEAWDLAEAGELDNARALAQTIPDYPLAPWVEYRVLMKKLYSFPAQEVEQFLQQQNGFWVSEKLFQFWIGALKQRDRYRTFLDFYTPGSGSTEQECYYYDAQRRIGNLQEAWPGAARLWQSARSQPKECDPLFAAWRRSDHYDPALSWNRYLLASSANQNSLARYLQNSILEAPYSDYAATAARIQQRPELIRDEQILDGIPASESLVATGLKRLARTNPDVAAELLDYYKGNGAIESSETSPILSQLSSTFARSGDHLSALEIAQRHADSVAESQVATEVRRLLPEQNWQLIHHWLDLLPEDEAAQPRWRYWQARAHEQLGLPYLELLKDLADERTFYGFLVSMRLQQPFAFEHESPEISDAQITLMREDQQIQRAIELNRIGFTLDARRAWFHNTDSRSREEWIGAAQVAKQEDWHFIAISSMIQADFWNDIETRFPLAYLEEIQSSADRAGISTSWAIAIARQESSFAEDIRSSAGAVGLMQLMPATAREMARANNVTYSAQRLNEPAYNSLLGTSYLRRAYDRLGDNEVYASAAYNAGISRAESWLRNDRDSLPLDIWIETIPFFETRGYVQNVMAFAAIYADKLGTSHPMERLGDRFFVSE